MKASGEDGDIFRELSLGNRAGKDDGGVAVANRRKLRVVEREGLRYCSIALFGRELYEEESNGGRDNSVRMEVSLVFRDSPPLRIGLRGVLDC